MHLSLSFSVMKLNGCIWVCYTNIIITIHHHHYNQFDCIPNLGTTGSQELRILNHQQLVPVSWSMSLSSLSLSSTFPSTPNSISKENCKKCIRKTQSQMVVVVAFRRPTNIGNKLNSYPSSLCDSNTSTIVLIPIVLT